MKSGLNTNIHDVFMFIHIIIGDNLEVDELVQVRDIFVAKHVRS